MYLWKEHCRQGTYYVKATSLDLPDVPGTVSFVAGAEQWKQRARDESEKNRAEEG